MEVDHGALFHRQNQESGGDGLIEQGRVRIGRRSEERLGFRVPPGFPGGVGFLLAEAVEHQPMGEFQEAGSARRAVGGSGKAHKNGMQDVLGLPLIAQQIQGKGVNRSGMEIV